jgi:hypothetical protein
MVIAAPLLLHTGLLARGAIGYFAGTPDSSQLAALDVPKHCALKGVRSTMLR